MIDRILIYILNVLLGLQIFLSQYFFQRLYYRSKTFLLNSYGVFLFRNLESQTCFTDLSNCKYITKKTSETDFWVPPMHGGNVLGYHVIQHVFYDCGYKIWIWSPFIDLTEEEIVHSICYINGCLKHKVESKVQHRMWISP